ncbi:hypothetical protein EJ06DRAFT_540904 [Trichodelitschia bisporula]|uniref:Filamentation protein-like protein n=1 Tax=Trichodelitschia bisporula TaxID=703511 RepID=A0A6G1I834_9PEZI|nr:hypothetical protein EJ06DRAFT_540904 [Trichodelitschia bisporula]
MSTRETEKALRYISQLDAARCNSQWDQVPELARKVEKHAPHRKTLILIAKTEAAVASYIPPPRPQTATNETTVTALSKVIPLLLSAIDQEIEYPEDQFQATICLGWIHWVLTERGLAVARMPKSIIASLRDVSSRSHSSPQWVQVCAIKGAYIKGFSQEKTASALDALETYSSMLPFLRSVPDSGAMSLEFRTWTERLLSRLSAVAMKSQPLGEWVDLNTMLRVFHLWTSLFRHVNPSLKSPVHGTASSHPPVELGPEVEYSRWDVWMDYYTTLSEILHRGYTYSPSYTEMDPQILRSRENLSDEEFIMVRLKQRTEIKKVEASIEAKLLDETRFPKANERNFRVERWVDAVMQNWRIMCGSTWKDEDLGEGGTNAVARGVLDILYRAATKTFHSTQILRYLFNVHAFIAEFDLAIKAFDSYAELVQQGHDCAEKSGEINYSIDDDDTIVHTASQAITFLCQFGSRKEAEKAREIAKKLDQWLKRRKVIPQHDAQSKGKEELTVDAGLTPNIKSAAYRALGISEAQWARLTFDAPARNGHQAKAVELFRAALHPRLGCPFDLETLYPLGLVLAEMREIPAAIKVVKQAIAHRVSHAEAVAGHSADGSPFDHHSGLESADYYRERKLIRFWHLLALLLTAKSDLTTAARSCNAAFEQFQSNTVLFGAEKEYRSEHLNETEKHKRTSKALVDRMDRYEKESILQVKLTQVALVEALEGPTAAVDASTELIALYSRLFGDPRADQPKLKAPGTSLKPPKSAGGTLRSSLIGRALSRRGDDKMRSVESALSNRPSTRATNATAAPTIQITDENGTLPRGRPKTSSTLVPARSRTQNGGQDVRRSPSHRLQKRSASMRRPSDDSARPVSVATTNEGDSVSKNGSVRTSNRASEYSFVRPTTAGSEKAPGSPDSGLRKIPHHFHHTQHPPPLGHPHQPPHQDTRLPTRSLTPKPCFPVIQERRQRVSSLVEIWLFIAGLYTRAALFDDANAAIGEAVELVKALELEIAQDASTAKAFAEKGWGGGISIEELWGDVWAQRGELARANSTPYEALSNYEMALLHFQNHPAATVGLSEILLDIYSQKIEAEPPEATTFTPPGPTTLWVSQRGFNTELFEGENEKEAEAQGKAEAEAEAKAKSTEDSPEELNRLAARDRAYNILSSLTKLGTGWDYSEAWFALARAYEGGGQVEKTKEVLWWCVELEDTRPLRGWGVVGPGGFVL